MWTRGEIAPSSRNCHSSLVVKGELYILGGYGHSDIYSDLLTYNIKEETWNKRIIKNEVQTSSFTRYAHKSIRVLNRIYVFGGYGAEREYKNDICSIEITNESPGARDSKILQFNTLKSTGKSPHPRAAFAMLQYNKYLWIFGGNSNLQFFNDMHTFSLPGSNDPLIHHWQTIQCIGDIPSQRSGHSMISALGPQFILFGGGFERGVFDDLYMFDPTTYSWMKLTTKGIPPCGRAGHTLTLTSGKQGVLFGGGDLQNVFNDLFVLDLVEYSWSTPQLGGPLPPPRAGHSASFSAGQLLVFGGGDVNGDVYNDLYSAAVGGYRSEEIGEGEGGDRDRDRHIIGEELRGDTDGNSSIDPLLQMEALIDQQHFNRLEEINEEIEKLRIKQEEELLNYSLLKTLIAKQKNNQAGEEQKEEIE